MKVNDVHYRVEVAGSGDPLLLLHGFTGSSASWSEFIPALSQHFTVIAPDLPGHGKTRVPDDVDCYTFYKVAYDLWSMLRKLGAKRPNILGYSMGGRLALYLAIMGGSRVPSLILESASPGLRTYRERKLRIQQDEALANSIEHDGIEAFVNFWEQQDIFKSQILMPPQALERQREQRLNNDPYGLAMSLRGMGTGVQPSLWSRLSEVQARTLSITGTGAFDPKFNVIAKNMLPLIPNAEHIVIPGAGHTTHLENPNAFHATVLRFLMPN